MKSLFCLIVLLGVVYKAESGDLLGGLLGGVLGGGGGEGNGGLLGGVLGGKDGGLLGGVLGGKDGGLLGGLLGGKDGGLLGGLLGGKDGGLLGGLLGKGGLLGGLTADGALLGGLLGRHGLVIKLVEGLLDTVAGVLFGEKGCKIVKGLLDTLFEGCSTDIVEIFGGVYGNIQGVLRQITNIHLNTELTVEVKNTMIRRLLVKLRVHIAELERVKELNIHKLDAKFAQKLDLKIKVMKKLCFGKSQVKETEEIHEDIEEDVSEAVEEDIE